MSCYTVIDSPIDPLLLVSDGHSLTGLYMDVERFLPQVAAAAEEDPAPFAAAIDQLQRYFAGELQQFDLPLSAAGTRFQRAVWQALREIPYGTTVSYKQMAQRLGTPGAVRAVGLANGRNPISIIVPCHRVIGANGKLVGYGGGMARKQWLLAHEARQRSLLIA
ncbi:MAG: methylated-DNA--[protein]-cysteine S-methyltransferase [Spongiibacteraceae bacterium]|jgi:methylated-DNA-[protein]-cysteine S-methyltransferase|nr:methylated-DNA--[protein]-cysteine S-methyltransferase [Spongiibacteraceae bacterium]